VRVLIRSEPEAFRLTVAGGVVLAVSLLVGYLFDPIAGVVVFAGAVSGALVVDLVSIRSERSHLRRAAADGHAHAHADGRRHVLLIANEGPTGDELSREIVHAGEPPPVLEVLAPVLQSRTHFVTTDVDRETAAARRRLRQTLAWAAAHQIEASGVVGDPIVPLPRSRTSCAATSSMRCLSPRTARTGELGRGPDSRAHTRRAERSVKHIVIDEHGHAAVAPLP